MFKNLIDKENFLEENRVVDESGISQYSRSSNYPNEDVGYNWLNCSYPYEHRHSYWEIIVVTSGTIINKIAGKDFLLKKGDVYVLRPDDVHSLFNVNQDEKQSSHLNFLLKTDYVKKIIESYGDNEFYDSLINCKKPLSFSLSDLELQDLINRILNIRSLKIVLKDKILQIKCIIQQLINQLIKTTYSINQNLPDWLMDFLFYLNNPYITSTDVKVLAEKTPYSYSRLALIFKNLTGRTIVEYITKIKMKCAQDLLKSSDMSILEIAVKLNYESLSHFIRTFKKDCGRTPSEYRKETKL